MSPSTEQEVTKKNEENDTLIEPNQAAEELSRETISTSLQSSVAAGLDAVEVEVEARRKEKKAKKDKKLNNKSLPTRKTWNDLQEITIEKLVRDDSSMSLQLLIDAAYGKIVIEVGESKEERKLRKKAEEMDRKMAKRMKKEAKRKNSSRGDKFDEVQKITIETLVRDETSESLQLLIDAAYGMIQIEVGESKEEKKERKKREKQDKKIVRAMQDAIKKKKREEVREKMNETKQATTNVSDKDGPPQNTRSKARARRRLMRKLEKKRAKEAGSEIKTIEKVKRFLGKRL
jgi:arginine decarboxylase-like protein